MKNIAKILCGSVVLVAAMSAHGQPSQNPVLREMALVHPLADKNANHTADLTGNYALDTVRRAASRNELRIVDDQGRQIGTIESDQAIEGFTIDDIDRDGQAEVVVAVHNFTILRAYDVVGKRLLNLDDSLNRLSSNYYMSTIVNALDSLALKVANGPQFGGLPNSMPEGPDVLECLWKLERELEKGNDVEIIYWNEVDFDGLTGLPLIEGTPYEDIIIGTDASDVIVGHGANDYICAAGGDDWVYTERREFDGDPTPNPIYPGLDVANNYAFGGDGNDIMVGGAVIDYLSGGNGDDSLFDGHGNGRLDGDEIVTYPLQLDGIGNDFLVGMWSGTWYFDGPGDDVVNAAVFTSSPFIPNSTYSLQNNQNDNDVCYYKSYDGPVSGKCENKIKLD